MPIQQHHAHQTRASWCPRKVYQSSHESPCPPTSKGPQRVTHFPLCFVVVLLVVWCAARGKRARGKGKHDINRGCCLYLSVVLLCEQKPHEMTDTQQQRRQQQHVHLLVDRCATMSLFSGWMQARASTTNTDCLFVRVGRMRPRTNKQEHAM